MQVLIKEASEHSHVPDPDRIHIVRLKNDIKKRGASSDENPSTILFDVLRTIPLSTVARLPSNDALLQSIRRERPATQLDHNGRLPLILYVKLIVERILFCSKMIRWLYLHVTKI